MALNFTGRLPPAPEEPSSPEGRAPVAVAAILVVAAMVAGLVFVAALRQHKADGPPALPPLVGTDTVARPAAEPSPVVQAAAPPQAVVAAPAEPAWIMHKAAAQPAPAPAAPGAAAPAPSAADKAKAVAAARARMLAALRQVPHGTVTLSVEDDPRAQAYAKALADLFHEAGWTVDQTAVFGSGAPRRGLAAAFSISPADEAVREAFETSLPSHPSCRRGRCSAPPPRS
jgi:hypothetical protein